MKPNQDGRPQQKTLLLTGAASGIGEALCAQYLALGWKVIACGRNPEKLALLATKENIQTLQLDLNESQQVLDNFAHLEGLDLVILNAGSCEYIDDVKHFDGKLFERVINTNLISIGYCLQALLPKMAAGSQLALVGSSASFLPFSRAQAYGASKAGIAYLASSLAIDLKQSDIDVSLIRPGFVKTPLTDKNDFNMPMRITSEQAATYIVQGLQKRQFDIHFPKKFTLILKAIAFLPERLWRSFSARTLQK
ncbi:SDR family NAD(P)-dependent oxidoreductase [Psychromonas sp. Urea-02u-13]|uniref:SDR family NAD(P)-dependent oxidoreductase n=1 Tax=Psychromonas sp. Urea-02u-13 TaxID=2058326 RepID=UPI000C3446C3|nr:SDR family NAD(P)-dependent oxidoreductase [Psychromonas sp. Urea-02u-13]PKG38477.1 short-chain dehydrogenase [Psychromonas sp. Urea-02u-13]